jgi:hypothetical protein
MYDTFARGMANLIYALDQSSDPQVVAVETEVSKGDVQIPRRRDILLANATMTDRKTLLRVRYLEPGVYDVRVNGRDAGRKTGHDLDRGLPFDLPPNTSKRVQVELARAEPTHEPPRRYDSGVAYLSDREPFAAQRGTGFPQPTYRRDRSFGDQPMAVGHQAFKKGLGCGANTVLVYALGGRFERFRATAGVDAEETAATNPPASVFFTAFVDGRLAFESGPMRAGTPPRAVDIDVRGAKTLMLRVSGNWDDDGRTGNDHGDWADARLIGRLEE